MIVIKTRNGTRTDQPSLCRSCSMGMVMKGAADSQEKVYCHSMNRFVQIDVVDCNSYYDRNLPDISDLYKTAWILESRPDRTIGFVPYRQYKKEHPREDVETNNPLRRL